jgi:proteasome lid subunit RPN8/RPN11
VILLSDAQLAAIRAHGVEEFPRECCGVLLGDVEGEEKRVHEVRSLPNTFEPSEEFERSAGTVGDAPVGQERRYMVSPDVMFHLMQEERRTGRKVLGFYHSHPDHPARPSEYDRVWAMPWYSYIILSVLRGVPDAMTSWTLSQDGGRFDEERIETAPVTTDAAA